MFKCIAGRSAELYVWLIHTNYSPLEQSVYPCRLTFLWDQSVWDKEYTVCHYLFYKHIKDVCAHGWEWAVKVAKSSDLGSKSKLHHLHNPLQWVTVRKSFKNTFLKNSKNFLREGMSILRNFNKSDFFFYFLLNAMVEQSHQVVRILFEKDKA